MNAIIYHCAIALVVVVLLAFQAMRGGFRQEQKSAGAPDIAMLMRDGAQTEITTTVSLEQSLLVEQSPGVARKYGRPSSSRAEA